jgi:hypothetical protein
VPDTDLYVDTRGVVKRVLFCGVAVFGCFRYAAVPTTGIAAGSDVRVTLTPDGRTALASRLGTQVRSVTGHVTSVDSVGLTVSLTKTTLLDGTDAPWNHEEIEIPQPDIGEVEHRALSTPKTIGMVAILAGVSAAVALSVSHGSSGTVTVTPPVGSK